MTARLLVTAAGGALAPLNIRLLREAPVRPAWVLAVDTRHEALGRHFADAFACVPSGGDPGYASAIAELVRRYDIDLVLPWSDEEALALAAARDTVTAAGATLCCAPLAALTLMSDKAATYRRLAEIGLAVADWELTATPDALAAAVDRFAARPDGFVVKPVHARGNRGTIVVRPDTTGAAPFADSREWHSDLATFRDRLMAETVAALPVLVMERLFAPAFDIDVLAGQGSVVRAVPRRRLNPVGIPFRGSVLERTPVLAELAARITEALELSWLYDFDIMSTADGAPRVIELNPRPSGSIAASILAGEPFYEDLIALAQGDDPMADRTAAPGPLTVVPYTDCRVVNASVDA